MVVPFCFWLWHDHHTDVVLFLSLSLSLSLSLDLYIYVYIYILVRDRRPLEAFDSHREIPGIELRAEYSFIEVIAALCETRVCLVNKTTGWSTVAHWTQCPSLSRVTQCKPRSPGFSLFADCDLGQQTDSQNCLHDRDHLLYKSQQTCAVLCSCDAAKIGQWNLRVAVGWLQAGSFVQQVHSDEFLRYYFRQSFIPVKILGTNEERGPCNCAVK